MFLKWLLNGKTRILITIQLLVSSMCDNVEFIYEGTAIGYGSCDELAKSSESFNQLVSEKQKDAKEQQNKDHEDWSFAAAEKQQQLVFLKVKSK